MRYAQNRQLLKLGAAGSICINLTDKRKIVYYFKGTENIFSAQAVHADFVTEILWKPFSAKGF